MAKTKKTTKTTTKTTYDPTAYVKVANPGQYASKYKTQLDGIMGQMLNYKYNPLEDARYQALAEIYGARGNRAAQDTLGDAASLNGGLQTSYAVSAAQQARNQYNQELAAMIPDLEAQSYNRLATQYDALRGADLDAYQQYRDSVSDYQWGKDYDLGLHQYKQQQAAAAKASKGSGGGGGGRRRRSGGGGGSSYYGGSAGSSQPDWDGLIAAASGDGNKPATSTKGGFSLPNRQTDYNVAMYSQNQAKKNVAKANLKGREQTARIKKQQQKQK